MRKWIVIAGAVVVPMLFTGSSVLLTASLATVVPGLGGCLMDACDEVKQDCRDKGLKPTNCKQETTALSDECQCDCVSKDAE